LFSLCWLISGLRFWINDTFIFYEKFGVYVNRDLSALFFLSRVKNKFSRKKVLMFW
jgi:hypothetical protein